MLVFRRHGFRRSSIEQAAEAAGLTRQALYHHFKSRKRCSAPSSSGCMRARSPRKRRRPDARKKAGGSLADYPRSPRSAPGSGRSSPAFDGSPHVEELFSEHLLQARDLYQKYAAPLRAQQLAATIDARLPQARPHAGARR